jgi:hypothetical protein
MFEPIGIHETVETNSEQIRTFATAPMSEALKLVRCGFELENQSIDEMSMDELSDFRFFKKEHKEKVLQFFNEHLDDKEFYSSLIRVSYAVRADAANRTRLDTHSYLSDIISKLKRTKKCSLRHSSSDILDINSELFGRVISDLVSNADELPDEYGYLISVLDDIRYQENGWDSSLVSYLEDLGIRLPDYIEFVEDGSVEGCEVRTSGPRTVGEFCKAVDTVFDIPMSIDEECSFHIHLSLDGVKHSYGPFIQKAMLHFFAANYMELPKSVRERLNNEHWVDRYFSIKADRERYRAIAYRGSTWEFRLFGNIDNAKDAKKCLMLAIKALRYAYRLRFCKPVKEKSFIHRKELPDIEDIERRMTGNSGRRRFQMAHIKKLEAKRLSIKKRMGKL